MKRFLPLSLVLIALAGPAMAMDVHSFLTKAHSLKQRGPLAPFSRDYGVLKAEIDRSIAAVRAERQTAQAAGRRPAYCPVGGNRIERTEIFAALEAVPVTQRSQVQVQDVLRRLYARKYPCPT